MIILNLIIHKNVTLLESKLNKRYIYKAIDRLYNLEKSYKAKVKRAKGKIRSISSLYLIIEKNGNLKRKKEALALEAIKKEKEERNKIENELQGLVPVKKEEQKIIDPSIEYLNYYCNPDIINEISKKNNNNLIKNPRPNRLDDNYDLIKNENETNNNIKSNEILLFSRPNNLPKTEINNDENKLVRLTKKHRSRFDLEPNQYNINFNLEFNKLHNIIDDSSRIGLVDDSSRIGLVDDSSRIGLVEDKPKIFYIVKTDEIFFNAKKEKNIKKYSKIFEIKNRNYNFFIKNTKVDCFQISITNYKSIKDRKQQITSNIKFIFLVILYFYLLFNIVLFIQSIHMLYGDNILKICLMPLISMILFRFLIISNMNILLITIILFYKGRYFRGIRPEKYGLLKKIIFWVFVRPMAFRHYQALVIYMNQFSKDYRF